MISVIDYGVGNLRSVEKALQFIGCEAEISSDTDFILRSDAVVLPGVGAFADAMESLEKAGMADVVRKSVNSGKPLLGICLGLQLLFEYSSEGREKVPGLGILKGHVERFPSGTGLKVPHMGWNCLDTNKNSKLFKGMRDKPYVYFVHSYCLNAAIRNQVAATCEYGIAFDAAIEFKNICATQFHPEKSGAVGLNVLKNWTLNIRR